MPRYIDADALYKETERRIKKANEYRMAVVDGEFLDLIDDAETADVVEVVRCRDCAYYLPMEGIEYKGKKAMHCFNHSRFVREDGFCDDWIRKEQT